MTADMVGNYDFLTSVDSPIDDELPPLSFSKIEDITILNWPEPLSADDNDSLNGH